MRFILKISKVAVIFLFFKGFLVIKRAMGREEGEERQGCVFGDSLGLLIVFEETAYKRTIGGAKDIAAKRKGRFDY